MIGDIMQISVDDPGVRLRITGRIAGRDLPDARQQVLAAVDSGCGELLLDVTGVVVTERAVLGLLLEAHRRAERQGRVFVLANVPPELDRLLRRTRLGRVLHCVDTV